MLSDLLVLSDLPVGVPSVGARLDQLMEGVLFISSYKMHIYKQGPYISSDGGGTAMGVPSVGARLDRLMEAQQIL